MRRFRILSLMGLVLVLAVCLAALRGANEEWAGGLLLATPLLLGISLIAAMCGANASRAGRLGFAILGGSYFALAFLGLSDGNLAKLPTSKLLWVVHERVVERAAASVAWISPPNSMRGFTLLTEVTPAGSSMTTMGDVIVQDVASGAPNRWRAMLPGAADYGSFQAVGHCLFALMAGLVGAVIARQFDRNQHRSEARS